MTQKCYDGSFPPPPWHLPLRADVLAKNHHRVDDMQPPTLWLEPWRGLAIAPKWKHLIYPITIESLPDKLMFPNCSWRAMSLSKIDIQLTAQVSQ